jgi:hypothetical protein
MMTPTGIITEPTIRRFAGLYQAIKPPTPITTRGIDVSAIVNYCQNDYLTTRIYELTSLVYHKKPD